MNKSLITLAVISAACGTAYADDVTLYGRADLGLVYTHNELSVGNTSTKDHAFTMESGNGGSSRFGLTGNETLGNGMKINFIVENGFKADSGELSGGKEGRIFDREASVGVTGAYGTIRAGRMASILTDAGSMGYYAGTVNPFGTGWGTHVYSHANLFANNIGVMDNVVGYISPNFAGMTVYAQYGMGEQGAENTARANRYAALGMKYSVGALELAGAVDWTNKKSVGGGANYTLQDTKDAMTVNFGGSYDFGAIKTFVATQYFKNASDVASIVSDAVKYSGNPNPQGLELVRADGYGLAFGASLPLGSGTAHFSTGMMDGDMKYLTEKADIYAFSMAGAYTYSLSKRTTLYTAAGYVHKELEQKSETAELDTYQAAVGMIHTF